jgi:hypothetical protein
MKIERARDAMKYVYSARKLFAQKRQQAKISIENKRGRTRTKTKTKNIQNKSLRVHFNHNSSRVKI